MISTLRSLLFLLLAVSVVSGAWADEVPEYDLKALFVYNFTLFVDWPPEASAGPLNICIQGSAPFGPTLEELENKTAKGRKIAIRRQPPRKEVRACHVLYLSNSEKGELPQWLEAVANAPVLVIGEMEGGAEQGVAINLQIENKRVVFEINQNAIHKARLAVSSKLLRLAKAVY